MTANPKRAGFAFFLLILASLSVLVLKVHAQTEFGVEDDFTALGTDGTVDDPDTEIKGFSVFGATQTSYTGSVIGPGNVVVNGYLAVSSGAYFVGNSTFTAANKIFVNDGTTGQMLRKSAGGYLYWGDANVFSTPITVQGINATPVTVLNVSTIQFNQATGLEVTDAGNNTAIVSIGSHWKELLIDGIGVGMVPYGQETLNFINGNDVDITSNSGATPKTLTIAVEDDIDVSTIQASSALGLRVYDDGANLAMFIKDGGNVGIGTTGPLAKLDVDLGYIRTSYNSAGAYPSYDGTSFLNMGGNFSVGYAEVDFWNSFNGGDAFVRGFGFLQQTGASSNRALMRITGAGNVSIGTEMPLHRLHLNGTGTSNPLTTSLNTIAVYDDRAQAAGVGGEIIFGGNYTDAGWQTQFAGIRGVKVNGTTGNYDGQMEFFTRANGNNDWTGQQRMVITSSGNVGIGTTSPVDRLEISSASGNIGIRINNVGNGVGDYSNIRFWQGGEERAAIYTNQGKLSLGVNSDDRFVIDTDGRIGIGTGFDAPGAKLEVKQAVSDSFAVKVSSNDGTGMVVVNNKGNVGIGTTNPLQKLQIGPNTMSETPDAISLGGSYSATAGANPKLRLFDDGTTSIYGIGVSANQFDFMVPDTARYAWTINGVEKMRLETNGNLGLSTGAPAGRLDVLASGSSSSDMAQIWRNSGGVIVGSMSATGVMEAAKLEVRQTDTTQAYSVRIGTSATAYHMLVSTSGQVAIGTSNPRYSKLFIAASQGTTPTFGTDDVVVVQRNANTADWAGLSILSGSGGGSYINFGDSASFDIGGIAYWNTDDTLRFYGNGAERVRIDASGNLQFLGGTPTYKVTNMAEPTANSDAATKAYVDAAVAPKYFYLTTTTGNGSTPLTACAAGYHIASTHELVSNDCKYNTSLGVTRSDSGLGPPTLSEGWVRSGGVTSGTFNCSLWTSTIGTNYGSTLAFDGVTWVIAWSQSCNGMRSTWCVQD
jgi:hypothetical protein